MGCQHQREKLNPNWCIAAENGSVSKKGRNIESFASIDYERLAGRTSESGKGQPLPPVCSTALDESDNEIHSILITWAAVTEGLRDAAFALTLVPEVPHQDGSTKPFFRYWPP